MDNNDDIKANWCRVQNRKKTMGESIIKKLSKTIEIGGNHVGDGNGLVK